jgi:hypothetical protein
MRIVHFPESNEINACVCAYLYECVLFVYMCMCLYIYVFMNAYLSNSFWINLKFSITLGLNWWLLGHTASMILHSHPQLLQHGNHVKFWDASSVIIIQCRTFKIDMGKDIKKHVNSLTTFSCKFSNKSWEAHKIFFTPWRHRLWFWVYMKSCL